MATDEFGMLVRWCGYFRNPFNSNLQIADPTTERKINHLEKKNNPLKVVFSLSIGLKYNNFGAFPLQKINQLNVFIFIVFAECINNCIGSEILKN